MATFEYSILTEIATMSNVATAVYTNPLNIYAGIRLIVLHNTSATAETIVLNNVPADAGSAGSAAAANQFMKYEMMGNETIFIEFPVPGLLLKNQNDTIQGHSTTSGAVTIQVMGGKDDVTV